MYPFGRGIARHLPMALLMLPLLLYVIFAFGPSVATVFFSFTNATGLPGAEWHFVGFKNYDRLFNSSDQAERFRSIRNSLQFAFLVVLVQNVVGLFMALLVNRKLRADSFIRATYFLPVVLGVTVSGLVWRMMMNPLGGPLTELFKKLHLDTGFLSSYGASFEWVIFVQIWMYMGYSMTIFLAGLQSIPKDLYDAAYIDGTSRWQAFRHVTFPMIAPSTTVNLLLSIIGALQTFDIIYVLTNGGFNTRTLAFDIYRDAIANNTTADYGLASAGAMVLFLFVFAIALVSLVALRRREVDL
ncbi:carbohydrate ABC transporter permease [Cohnella silvisoli]|uniref:Sugar ABC transporter permease n=1 Tax=Cohnella silvisoli TaxID=2873699 RepID=A0ABV1KN60_9BACL|nr:sugar ABC transporter permease [Cohnella silvisoli]MCD9020196.1 sugar ABC transporter permease [Cohnella silvisoli]